MDIDPPGLTKTPNRTGHRMLCIKVVVTDGCTNKETVFRFNQYVEVSQGKLVVIVDPRQNPGTWRSIAANEAKSVTYWRRAVFNRMSSGN